MKKISILLTSLFFIISGMNANKPIILWDIHNVLLQPQDRVVTFFSFPHLKEVFTNFSWPLIKDFAALALNNLYYDTSSEEYIQTALKHNNPHLAELIIALANCQRPLYGMKKIVDQLHAEGYEQTIGSNIGQTAFRKLLDAHKYPYAAPMFTHMNLNKSIVARFHNGTIIKKPDRRFYEHYLALNNIELKTTPVIFIDDNYENVRVARSMGFDGIVFKNPDQLKLELRKRGLPIDAPRYAQSSQREYHVIRPSFIRNSP